MQIVRLFDAAPKNPDGWHRVASPGGYEIWNFEAVDPEQVVRVVVRFHQGGDFSGNYRRRYKSFLNKPTRRLPPLPAEFPGVQILITRNGNVVFNYSQFFTPADFSVAEASSRISVGSWDLDLREAEWRIELNSIGHLVFAGKSNPVISDELLPLYSRPIGSEHHWIINHPICVVQGEIQLSETDRLKISGRGFCDHRYGTGPWAFGARQWISGTALFPDQSVAFRAVVPKGCDGNCFCISAEKGAIAKSESDISDWKWDGQGDNGIAFPKVIRPNSLFTLDQPQILLEEQWHSLLRYRAQIGSDETFAFVETGTRAK